MATLKINSLEAAMKVNTNHMWRHSSGLDLNDQIAVREFRVEKLKALNAPDIIMNREQKTLDALLRKRARES